LAGGAVGITELASTVGGVLSCRALSETLVHIKDEAIGASSALCFVTSRAGSTGGVTRLALLGV
jgi:hypothetical protein